MAMVKTPEQIDRMREAGAILAACHEALASVIQPGITTSEIDQFVEQFLEERGATPEQKGYQGYPYATCASVNDVICHGFPSAYELKSGDIVKIDMVVNRNGWLADSAWCYAVGEISDEAQRLLDVTKKALFLGIEQAIPGHHLGDIGHAIQSYAEREGFSVVRDFAGHGIGRKIHEQPIIPHYGRPGTGMILREGMCLTIEPMLNLGTYKAKIDSDGWTARTLDGKLSAQYEHTIAITKEGPIILTA
ncbi:type I methionyl aminopeptidase [Sulfoacidibacillus thermotolerans]|uniref:Methionine aminopeptidase n=1 Tax=Sulfoacidibacillus thermotolerans TaxID=1765684 RepID=A0A2U3DB87_SULT2|nr:type I methionyl aminopeptidase [Sulfoacidibacillus thermotolerans]PWI58522.1 type I methionyl aminopeptidase [Sulfoacidibacillus thermotolerans]